MRLIQNKLYRMMWSCSNRLVYYYIYQTGACDSVSINWSNKLLLLDIWSMRIALDLKCAEFACKK